MAEAGSLEKQAREAVVADLAKGGTRVAAIIGQHISMAARAEGDPRRGVVEAVRGGMNAVFLANHDLTGVAIKVLESLPNLSLMSRVGPEEVMTWVMEGIASAALMAGGELEGDIRSRIEEQFHGAGDIFASLCDKLRQKA